MATGHMNMPDASLRDSQPWPHLLTPVRDARGQRRQVSTEHSASDILQSACVCAHPSMSLIPSVSSSRVVSLEVRYVVTLSRLEASHCILVICTEIDGSGQMYHARAPHNDWHPPASSRL